MNLTERQQSLLNIICSCTGGVDIQEAMKATGLSYPDIEKTAYELISKGIQISATKIGEHHPDPRFNGWIKRLFLSPYDRNYNQLIENRGNLQ
jgi:hypothetical protein